MADERARIVLDGDVSPLRQKLREAGNDLRQFGAEGGQAFDKMIGPLRMVQERFVAIGAILAGGAVFKEAVRATSELTEESIKLAGALGDTASNASVLREALTAGNTSQEEFVTAAKGLSKQIRENEAGLNAMGLKTRDAAGQLRPLNDLVFDAIRVMNDYRAGTDRAIAGQTMFGKGFEMTSNLARMTQAEIDHTREVMESLNMVVSQEGVDSWRAYDDATDDANLTLKGIKTTIGNAVMPVLTDLSNWFAAIGPGAVLVIRGALGGLVAAFHYLTTGVTALWETINAFVFSVAEPLIGLSQAMTLAMQGDFAGAGARLKGIFTNISDAWSGAMDRMAEKAKSTNERIWNLFVRGSPTAAENGGGKSATDLLKDKNSNKRAEQSAMPSYETALAALKNAYEQENALRQFGKEQELEYWRAIQNAAGVTANDRIAIAKRTATLEMEIRRTAARDQRALDAVAVDSRRAASLGQIAIEEQQAGFARENGEMTKAQLIDLEERFARRRFEIEYQALLERLELAKSDPGASPEALARIKEQMLEVERQYQLRRNDLSQDRRKADGSLGAVWDDAGSAFDTMASNLLTRATTLREQLAQVFQSIYQSFVQNLVTKPLGEWVAAQARMLASKLGFVAQEKAMDTAAAASKAATKSAETAQVVAANAAEAGSGAAASQASIPIVGPALALAAMAAVFGAVMALGSKKSAARGYDIPKGLNPLTQLHEEEMVLPQKYANVIRRLESGGDGGGGGGGGFTFAPVIKAMDSRDVARALREGGALHKTLKDLERSFVR